MKTERFVKKEISVGLDAETIELIERLRKEEMAPVATYLRKAIRSYVMSEAARRGWLRREEAAAPQIASS